MEQTIILKRKMDLQISSGEKVRFIVHAVEYDDPYCIVVGFKERKFVQMTITNNDLSSELKEWLGGKIIENPSLPITSRIEEVMMKFLKFGKPPSQLHLIYWILSRAEIVWDEKNYRICFGGRSNSKENIKSTASMINPYPSIVEAAMSNQNFDDLKDFDDDARKEYVGTSASNNQRRPSSAPTRRKNNLGLTGTKAHPHEIAKDLLGSSDAIKKLEQGNLKRREGAKVTLVRTAWNNDHFRLTSDILTGRQQIEDKIEERRKMMEISNTRQKQAMDKFKAIRDKLNKTVGDNAWVEEASNEVFQIRKVQADVESDVLKQKVRAHRATEHVRWTIAPNGFANRRGQSVRGPMLGPGPLPPEATTSLKDPRILAAEQGFYWDQAGRRHVKRPEDIEQGSAIDQAMTAIRKASANASLYKLDLHEIFNEIDTSGNGAIDIHELGEAFARLGLQLDDESLVALFKHFDPNGSGNIQYGEFMWAFFNRRSFVRQWQRKTSALTPTKIMEKFHLCDINGDGQLNKKEFRKLLKSFEIEMTDTDVDTLMRKFDSDGNNKLNLNELKSYIDQELQPLIAAAALANNKSSAGGDKEKGDDPTTTAKNTSETTKIKSTTSVPGLNFKQKNKSAINNAPLTTTSARKVPTTTSSATAVETAAIEFNSSKSQTIINTKIKLSQSLSETENLYKSLGEQWLENVLQKQSTVEAKLGPKYYGDKKINKAL